MSKRAIITGGSKGIGKAIVEKFVSRGYDIAFCSRSEKDLQALKTNLSDAYPDRELMVSPCDASDGDQIKSWCEEIKSRWDRFDILVNNAGYFLPGSVLKEPEQHLLSQIELNLYSAYRFTRELIALIEKNGSGHIFNMCSIASQKAYPSGGAYTISKFALYGFSQCLREELKPTNIKVTAVLPGATWSDSWQGSGFDESDMISAKDVADLIYSCSQLSKQAVVEEIRIRPQGGDL